MSEHLGIHLEEFLRIRVVHDAKALLLFDRSRQLKVHSANVGDHIPTLFGTKNALVPGTSVGLQGQVDAFVMG